MFPGPGLLMVTRCRTLGPGEFGEALAVALERRGGAVPPFGVEERIGTLTDPLEEIFGGLVGRPRDGVGERAVTPGCELAFHNCRLGQLDPMLL